MPKVSVIVPFYNVENYIEKCLNSLVNQTLEEIQIILVNDGSKDKSVDIVKDFLNRYPEKILYLEKENGGLSDARNFGIPYAKGEYIAFLDSDDYVEKDIYENMYDIAKKENSDMVECDFYWVYPHKMKQDIGEIYDGKKEMLEKIRVVAWNKLIRRELIQKININFPKGYRYEDVEFTYKLVPFLEKVSFVKKPMIYYMQRLESISNSQNERNIEIFDVLDNVISFYKEKDIYNEYKNILEYLYVRYAFCSSLLRMVKIKNKEIKCELLKETWQKVNTTFPDWKKNKILNKNINLKKIYIKSINKFTYHLYIILLSLFLRRGK